MDLWVLFVTGKYKSTIPLFVFSTGAVSKDFVWLLITACPVFHEIRLYTKGL